MFTYQTKIKLHDTDAAGVIFFANQFKIIHDAYESLLEGIEFGFANLIRNKDFFCRSSTPNPTIKLRFL